MMVLDGSFGEGGGQIMRTALSLSCVTGRAFRIENVRANRSNPGLAAQHLACLRATRDISLADVEGDAMGATEVTFVPRAVRAGKYRFVIETAGSAMLLFQTVLTPLSLAEARSELELVGGTHVPWSPCFDYVDDVYLPALADAGYRAGMTLSRAGFYPKGGGRVEAQVDPIKGTRPVDLSQRAGAGAFRGMAWVSRLPASIAHRECTAMQKKLEQAGVGTGAFHVEERDAQSPGNAAGLVLEGAGGRAGFFALGKKGKSAENVAAEAADEAIAYIGGKCGVDAHLADQLVVPLAAANAQARYTTSSVTDHLRTNVEVVNAFLPGRVKLSRTSSGAGVVEIASG